MGRFGARLLCVRGRADAERELARIDVDPGGIARMAGKMSLCPVHLPGLQCRQANILKQEMLAVGGDAAVARGSVACSIERSDCILIGSDRQLRILAARLPHQPFGLAALAVELLELLDRAASPPAVWNSSKRSFPLDRPLIMGILNVTPDSFSDGGRHFSCSAAVEHALRMVNEGADIIDVGGESTRPGAPQVPVDEELRRVVPVIGEIVRQCSAAVSVDTWKSVVAREALAGGAEIINDVSGFSFDGELAGVAAESGAGVVLMHTRGRPERMQDDTAYRDLMGEVVAGLTASVEAARSAGIMSDRIAVDPGIGFGKDTGGNLELLRRLPELCSLGLPVLVGTSRKSFIGRVLGREVEGRLPGTASTVALAVANGARIVRVHDVAAMRDTALMAHAIASGDWPVRGER